MEEQVVNPTSPVRPDDTELAAIIGDFEDAFADKAKCRRSFEVSIRNSPEAKYHSDNYKNAKAKIVTLVAEKFSTLRKLDSLHILKRCVEDEDKNLWRMVEARLEARPDYVEGEVMDEIMKHEKRYWFDVLGSSAVGTKGHEIMKDFVQQARETTFKDSKHLLQGIFDLSGYKNTLKFFQDNEPLRNLNDHGVWLQCIPEELTAVPDDVWERCAKEANDTKEKFQPDLYLVGKEVVRVYEWKFWCEESIFGNNNYGSDCWKQLNKNMQCLQSMYPGKTVIGTLVVFPKWKRRSEVEVSFVEHTYFESK